MIAVSNIRKRYNGTDTLKGISFDLCPGETLVVAGPSGCGKTTLLRIIAGLERPDEGSVSIDGSEVSSPSYMAAPYGRGVSMIFQDLALWPHMTAEEHIRFVYRKNGVPMEQAVAQALSAVSLTGFHHRYPHQLSGGERQRLAIARALASRPAYLLMDEPFSNLDTILKEEMQELLINLKKSSPIGIIYVTHTVEEATAFADSIAVVKGGELVQFGTKEAVLQQPVNDFVRRLLRV
jgi:ABC-type Fe3+/spermidine/putrescine transport system ATPase subunit